MLYEFTFRVIRENGTELIRVHAKDRMTGFVLAANAAKKKVNRTGCGWDATNIEYVSHRAACSE